MQLARDTYRVRFDCPELAQIIVPGQFVMLRMAGCDDPLLGRPFALYDTVLDSLWLCGGHRRGVPGDGQDDLSPCQTQSRRPTGSMGTLGEWFFCRLNRAPSDGRRGELGKHHFWRWAASFLAVAATGNRHVR